MAGLVPIPDIPIQFTPAKAGEVLRLGPIICRVTEDGSHTDNRLGTAEFILPPGTSGPPPHWHEMHDETFYITSGTIRFHVPDPSSPGKDKQTVDCSAGDYMVVPVRAPHTFSNPGKEEGRFFFTSTPAFYINYFKLLANLAEKGGYDGPLPAEVNVQAMGMFSTILVDREPRRAKAAEGAE